MIEELEKLVDKHFPIKNEDGTPHYRKYQRETIIKIIQAFENGKKFVCLDGPVGCGKSAINYTVGMVMGSTVYLTHQKQLQDQVAREMWPEVKMVKGRGAYCCNGATLTNEKIRCNYSGENYVTCNNSDKYVSFDPMGIGIMSSIERVRKMYADNDRVFRMRTGFEHNDVLTDIIDDIRSFVDPDNLDPASLQTAIGCKISHCECPVKSTRLFSKMYKIKILNPDVFYALNRGMSQYFPNSNLMIIDECHKIENIVERIFGGHIHVGFIKEFFGIDMSELYDCGDINEFVEKYMYLMKTVVMPAKCAAALVSHIAPIMHLTCLGGRTRFTQLSTSVIINEFQSISHRLGDLEHHFSIIDFLKSVFAGECRDDVLKPAWILCRSMFTEMCDSNECDQVFNNFSAMCPYDDPVKSMHNIAWFPEAIEHLEDVVGLMSVPGSFMFSKTDVNMWEKTEESDINRFVRERIPFFGDANRSSIKVTPINISSLMNTFFYSKAEKVLLSTGTWIDQVGMMKTFGVDLDSVETVSVPTTFNRDNRRVYILQGSEYMDFAQKCESGEGYLYKTPAGTVNFCRQVGDIAESARAHYKKEKGLNINIVIHSFSFDLAKRIAKYCPYVDDSWLIQIAKNDKAIRNEVTGKLVSYVYKDELLEHMFNHKNSGLTLVSPSVAEGVDFKYDIARAQIILKRPTPYLGDPYVNAQYKGNPAFGIPRDPNYLDRVTYIDIMQMYGRIMRAEDDWGVTIVYDQAITKSFNSLLSQRGARRVKELGLDYFVSAIKGHSDDYGFPVFTLPFK